MDSAGNSDGSRSSQTPPLNVRALSQRARERYAGRSINVSAAPDPAWVWSALVGEDGKTALSSRYLSVRQIRQQRLALYLQLHPDRGGTVGWSQQLEAVWTGLQTAIGWVKENPTADDYAAMDAQLHQLLRAADGRGADNGLSIDLSTRLSMLQSDHCSVAAAFGFARLFVQALGPASGSSSSSSSSSSGDTASSLHRGWLDCLTKGHQYYKRALERRAGQYVCREGVTEDVRLIVHEVTRLLAHLVIGRQLPAGAWRELPSTVHSCAQRYHARLGAGQAAHALALLDMEWSPYDFAGLADLVPAAVQRLVQQQQGGPETKADLPRERLDDARAEGAAHTVYSWWLAAMRANFDQAGRPECLVEDMPSCPSVHEFCRDQVAQSVVLASTAAASARSSDDKTDVVMTDDVPGSVPHAFAQDSRVCDDDPPLQHKPGKRPSAKSQQTTVASIRSPEDRAPPDEHGAVPRKRPRGRSPVSRDDEVSFSSSSSDGYERARPRKRQRTSQRAPVAVPQAMAERKEAETRPSVAPRRASLRSAAAAQSRASPPTGPPILSQRSKLPRRSPADNRLIADRFAAFLKSRGKSPSTVATYTRQAASLLELDMSLDDLPPRSDDLLRQDVRRLHPRLDDKGVMDYLSAVHQLQTFAKQHACGTTE